VYALLFRLNAANLLIIRAKVIKSAAIDKTSMMHKEKAFNDMRDYDDDFSGDDKDNDDYDEDDDE
jgi:hypothetical protein